VESDGRALVLPGGWTVAERVRQGPVPIDEALGIARQVAEAVEAGRERSDDVRATEQEARGMQEPDIFGVFPLALPYCCRDKQVGYDGMMMPGEGKRQKDRQKARALLPFPLALCLVRVT
jgi:hypothetical protein